jgi:hypothetical protein
MAHEGGLDGAAASEPAPSPAADSLAASVARLAEAVDRVTDVVKALFGAEGVSKAVKDLIEQVGGLVSALLGGNGASDSSEGLIGRVSHAVGELAQGFGGVFGGLLGGDGDGAPAPAGYYLSAQPLAAFYYEYEQSYEQSTTALIEWSAAEVSELARMAGGALGGSGGLSPNQGAGKPATPPVSPPVTPPVAPLPLVPVAPPFTPVGYSTSFLGASGSAPDVFLLLFAVLAVFSVALLQGGRLSWLRRESHGPPTAVVLAIERPG